MEPLFMPYRDNRPATVCINGHRVMVLSHEKGDLEENLELLEANAVQLVEEEGLQSIDEALQRIADTTSAKVFLAPANSDLRAVLETIRGSLPWMQ